MKFFTVYIFTIVAYASAASIPQHDGSMYELMRISKRDAYPEADPAADPAADPEGYPEAYADGYVDALGYATANAAGHPNAYALANAAPNAAGQPHSDAVVLPDDDYIRSRRFTCSVLSPRVRNTACAVKCLAQRRRGGSCRGRTCVCR